MLNSIVLHHDGKKEEKCAIRRARAPAGAPVVAFLALLVLICFSAPAFGQTWNGSVSNLWNNASNWTPNGVPNSFSSVVITNATNNPVLINTTVAVDNLTLGGSNSATLDNGQVLELYGGAGAGSISNAGTITINSTGSNTNVILDGNFASIVTLSGGGTVSLSNFSGNAVWSLANIFLDNQETIQGSGQIGIGSPSFAFWLFNSGTIDANQSVALSISNPGMTATNTGTLEATAGGTLNLIDVFTNTNGLIRATGAGSVVNLGGSTINGGTLTTTTGGEIRNNGTATVNGVTISTGSTLTLLNGATTTIQGTITNNGTMDQHSTGSNTDLLVSGAVTLTGSGSLILSNNSANRIYGSGSDSLTNDVNHTIQGAGQIGIGGANAFTLDNKGTILANDSNTLIIAPGKPFTNTGTLQVNSGSLMHVEGSAGSFTNFSGNTLTGGTYAVHSGTLQIDQLGSGGGEINTLGDGTAATTVLLDGASAAITDQTGKNALNLSNVAANASLTLENGNNMTTSQFTFANAGSVTVGNGSTLNLFVYKQSGGSLKVNGTLKAGTAASIQAGTVSGGGTIVGVLFNQGGVVTASDPGSPDILTINGSYLQGAGGTLEAFLEGTVAGTGGYSQLDVTRTASLTGAANLSGMLDVDMVTGSNFDPVAGDDFFVLLADGGFVGSPALALDTADAPPLPNGDTWSVNYETTGCPNGAAGCVELQVNAPVPEPSSVILFGTALAMAAFLGLRKAVSGS
ncbi:MAG TPA: PEP-CTERM sorting domain-containing protein [Terriglobia bacterium]|nr:PEP-CTERM sorting domain-containing protein [Terriglobia bacterium]